MRSISILLSSSLILILVLAVTGAVEKNITTSNIAPIITPLKAEKHPSVHGNFIFKGTGGQPSTTLDQFCPTNSFFDQPPTPISDDWGHYISEQNPGFRCHENFSSVEGIICEIQFWGLNMVLDGEWGDCESPENPMPFEIIFYEDYNGEPGEIIQSFAPTLAGTPTGEFYNQYELKAYEFELDPCLDIINGWISIQGQGDIDCWFLWTTHGVEGEGYALMNGSPIDSDLSLCLTGDPIDRYGACCDDITGYCIDDILMEDCPPPLRWAYNAACFDLVPECGTIPGACCDDSDGTCQDDVHQMHCPPPLRWEAYALCPELDPPCGGCPEDTLTINIFTDEYPEETTWDLMARNTGEIIAYDGPLEDQLTLHTWEICIDFDGCFDFTIYDSFGDGICCLNGEGYYEIYLNSAIVASNYHFTGSVDIATDIGSGCEPLIGACCVDGICEVTNTEEECSELSGQWYEGETCPEFECPTGPCDGAIYSNGVFIMDYGSPASQYAGDYPFAAGAADDFILPGSDPINITGVTAWTTHWNGAEGQGPNLYEGVNVTVYADYQGAPGGELLDDGTRIEYTDGGIVYTTRVDDFAFEQEYEPCTGDMWRLELPVDVILTGGITYWLEIQPVLPFSGGGQAAVSLSDMNHGSFAMQIFAALGDTEWRITGGNSGSCVESPPGGTMFDLAFCLHSDQVEIEEYVDDLPARISLHQNYPNPFNAQTTIKYDLPKESKVTIEIYDLMGRLVATLQDGLQSTGYHQIIWDANDLSSGVYFYRLQAADYTETRKIVLMK
ncbi:MAG: T9SS type A sorting domain-containing protein [candidate division Zixibacteria bacterium]|nr:T9SS type A sorting domain-containing protein [candidate division Zixibacteria bacterium]